MTSQGALGFEKGAARLPVSLLACLDDPECIQHLENPPSCFLKTLLKTFYFLFRGLKDNLVGATNQSVFTLAVHENERNNQMEFL